MPEAASVTPSHIKRLGARQAAPKTNTDATSTILRSNLSARGPANTAPADNPSSAAVKTGPSAERASIIASVQPSRHEASSSSARRRVAEGRACARRGVGCLGGTSSGAYPERDASRASHPDDRYCPKLGQNAWN